MYLNTAKLATAKIVNTFIIIFMSFSAFFKLLFIMYGLTVDTKSRPMAMVLVFLCAVGLAGSIAIIIWRAKAISRNTRARIYNSLMEEDHDGILTYDSISSMTGVPVHVVIKDVMWFINHRYLINVTAGRTAIRADVMSQETEFITVVCPHCGSHVNIRKQGGGRCDHCGTFMRMKGEQDVL
ncbi:MAG: hypothetical protein J6X33_00945 [Clostridiales bacterium]|nr:hypothetical protein [Clostridiales bacterium]